LGENFVSRFAQNKIMAREEISNQEAMEEKCGKITLGTE